MPAENPPAYPPTPSPTPASPAPMQQTMTVHESSGMFAGLTTFQKVTGLTGMTLVVAFAFCVMLYFITTTLSSSNDRLYDLWADRLDRMILSGDQQVEKLEGVKAVGYQNQRVMRESSEAAVKSMKESIEEQKKIGKESLDEQKKVGEAVQAAVIEMKKQNKKPE